MRPIDVFMLLAAVMLIYWGIRSPNDRDDDWLG
jgi:hypothetical protein